MVQLHLLSNKLLILIALASSTLPAAISNDTSFSAIPLSTVPGAMGDPLKALELLDPSFSIPLLNRIPPSIEGAPPDAIGYSINGCPLLFTNTTTDLMTLSGAQVYSSAGISGSGTSLTTLRFPCGPYHFDGFRSWFNGMPGLQLSIKESAIPLEQGFFTGPLAGIQTATADTAPAVNSRIDNMGALLGLSVPPGHSALVTGSGRIGYNRNAVRDWVQPYTSYGDNSYTPFYGDCLLAATLQPTDRLDIKMHFLSAWETLKIHANHEESAFSLEQRHYSANLGAAVQAQILGHIDSKSNVSLSLTNGSAEMENSSGPVFNDTRNPSVLSFTQKFAVPVSTWLAPCFGIDTRKHFGTFRLALPTAAGTMMGDTLTDSRFSFAPFAGIHASPGNRWEIDFGLRFDSYGTADRRHGSLLAVTPRLFLADSTSGNLCYRFLAACEVSAFLRIALASGTASQSPTIDALDNNPGLRSVKSARHSLTAAGETPFGLGYRLAGFYNEHWDLPVYPEMRYFDEYYLQSIGGRRSKGVTVQVDRTFAKLITATLGYSISSNASRTGKPPVWIRSAGDRRHKFNTLLQGHLPFGIECGINFMATSGTPYTPLNGIIEQESGSGPTPIYGSFNLATGDPYCNLSASVSYTRRFGNLRLGAFFEGANLLQVSPDDYVPFEYRHDRTSQQPAASSIDSRSVAFGITIGY